MREIRIHKSLRKVDELLWIIIFQNETCANEKIILLALERYPVFTLKMHTEIIPYAGWEKNLRLSNDVLELIVTLDVGPRILSYCRHRGENVLKQYPEQLGKSGEPEWCIRGGHRLWTAPEDLSVTYHVDNIPVTFSQSPAGEVLLTSYQKEPIQIRKEIALTLGESSHVILRHSIFNEGTTDLTLSPWTLTVMAPGGLEIIPQPPLGKHPRDLLPNRKMVLWSYTDLSDPRWNFGTQYITLKQKVGSLPTKLGLAHRQKWVAYLLNYNLFIKSFSFEEGALYPDGGCNFETFSNSEMTEIESLGPLKKVRPGEAVQLREDWYLFKLEKSGQLQSSLENWLPTFLQKAELFSPSLNPTDQVS